MCLVPFQFWLATTFIQIKKQIYWSLNHWRLGAQWFLNYFNSHACCIILLFRSRRSLGTGEGAFQGRAGDVGWKDQSKADLCGCLHFLDGSVPLSFLLIIAYHSLWRCILQAGFEANIGKAISLGACKCLFILFWLLRHGPLAFNHGDHFWGGKNTYFHNLATP